LPIIPPSRLRSSKPQPIDSTAAASQVSLSCRRPLVSPDRRSGGLVDQECLDPCKVASAVEARPGVRSECRCSSISQLSAPGAALPLLPHRDSDGVRAPSRSGARTRRRPAYAPDATGPTKSRFRWSSGSVARCRSKRRPEADAFLEKRQRPTVPRCCPAASRLRAVAAAEWLTQRPPTRVESVPLRGARTSDNGAYGAPCGRGMTAATMTRRPAADRPRHPRG
jgi:hypothetical protein